MLNKSTEVLSGDGFQMVSADGIKEGKKKNNGAAVASNRIGAAITPMKVKHVVFDIPFTTKPLVGDPLKNTVDCRIRYPGLIGFLPAIIYLWRRGTRGR